MVTKFHVAALAALMSSVGLQPIRADENQKALQPGVAVERGLAAGESHVYTADLAAGKRWLLTVEQHGIDVVLAATTSDGMTVTVDAPSYRQSAESLLLPPEVSGIVRIEVRSALRAVGPGRYELAMRELAGVTAEDRRRLVAETAMTEAGQLNHKGTAETRRQAIAKYVEALNDWRRLGDRRQEARALFSIGALCGDLGESGRALDAYRLALPLLRMLEDRDAEAIALNDMGLAHWEQGDSDRARELLDEAMSLHRSLGNRYGEAITLNNRCLRAHSSGELRSALACYQRALELLRELGELELESTLLSNIGSVFNNLGEPRSALANHRRALALRRTAGDRSGQARTLKSMAVVYRHIGEMQEALSRYAQALEILREVKDQRLEAVTLNGIGTVYYQLGESGRARAYLDQALRLRRKLADRRGEHVTLTSLGRVHASLGDQAQAMELHRKALELRRTLGDRRGEARSLHLIGQGLAASGEIPKAIGLFDQAIEISDALGDRRDASNALHAKGAAQLAAGEPEPALAGLRRALDLRRAVGDRHGEAQTLHALARTERQLGRRLEARRVVEESLDVVESLRTRVSDPGLRATFLASQRSAYELHIDLLMELHAAEPERGFARRAFEASERARGRSLLDVVDEAAAEVRQGIAPALRDRRSVLLERLNAKATRRLQLLGRGREQQAAELELYAVLAELESVEANIRAESPYQAALTRPQPLSLEEIRRLLDQDTALLEYALGEERSFLWLLTVESFAAFELPGRAAIETMAREVHRQLATLDVRAAEHERDAASELGRMLLGPVVNRLDGQRLVIVADGALHYVPFAVLPVQAAAESGAEKEPLILRHEIVHLYSASSLAIQRRHFGRRPPAPHWAAVLADPVFDGEDPRVREGPRPAPLEGNPPAGTRGLTRGESAALHFDRLPSTRREARAIADLAPPGEALLNLDFSASRARVMGGDLSGYRIVHFATHGLIDASRPELSGLVLSQVDSKGNRQEGFLRLRDISNLELAADLVVLSGCKTAWGREVRGEGLIGLARGFMAAGVPRVVASLWRVEDRVTAELMSVFYRSMWREGLSPAAALRQAQLSVLRQRRWRDAYYWGAFVLQGDWR